MNGFDAVQYATTNASVKSYQLVKVVSGGWKKFKFGITTTFSN